ncbi:uncharacterized protein [Syngnathus scovelli]|uniref:uncharacterized protein isoform X2 n=1 Tax=Syngnathus scovelli TaxID=161590 RepID=UPI0035CC914A
MPPSFAARLLMTLTLCQTCTELFGCPTGWPEYNKHCYFFGNDRKTWWDARLECASKGAHLDWLQSLKKSATAWIGLRCETTDRPWQWADATSFYYLAWDGGETNNWHGNEENCVEMLPRGHWNVFPCASANLMPYICKRPVSPTTTTAKPVTCPTPAPCPTTTTAKPATCPTPAPCPTTTTPAKPATCPTPAPCPTTPAKPATCPTPAPCPTTTAKPATSPAGPPPTDGELEMCAISTKDKACSSHNVTCSCLLAMIANPMGGFQAVLDGLSVARSIVIRGQSNAKAKRLVVNLDARDANGKNATAALHLNMDLESQTFTLNSGVDRKWGDKQTGDLPRERPFGAGLPFKIVIKWALSTWTSTTSSSWTSQVLNLILGASIGWRCGK